MKADSTKDAYEEMGSEGLRHIASQFGVDDDVEYFVSLTSKGDRVLDLACGYGRVSFPLQKCGRKVTGIDIASSLIEAARTEARKKELPIQFDVGTMTELPYKAGTFDVVVCPWNSFSHLYTIKDQVACLNEVHRVLDEKGSAHFILPNGENTFFSQNKDKHNIVSTQLEGQTLKQYVHTRASLKKVVKKTKFENNKISFTNLNKRRRIVLHLWK